MIVSNLQTKENISQKNCLTYSKKAVDKLLSQIYYRFVLPQYMQRGYESEPTSQSFKFGALKNTIKAYNEQIAHMQKLSAQDVKIRMRDAVSPIRDLLPRSIIVDRIFLAKEGSGSLSIIYYPRQNELRMVTGYREGLSDPQGEVCSDND